MNSAFKIQTHKMFLDTTFNSLNTVLTTIYQNFTESAMKYYRYAKCMAAGGVHPHASLLIGMCFPDTRVRFLLYILYDAPTLLERTLTMVTPFVRYDSGSGEFGLCAHQSEAQNPDCTHVQLRGEQTPSAMVRTPAWAFGYVKRPYARSWRNVT